MNDSLHRFFQKIFDRAAQSPELIGRCNLILIDSVGELEISTLKQAIVFLMATWSCTSRTSYRTLVQVLGKDRWPELRIYVVNIDSVTEEFIEQQLPSAPHGDGETYWVRDGRIEHSMTKFGNNQADLVESYTRDIAR
jgi:hypothetical protein